MPSVGSIIFCIIRPCASVLLSIPLPGRLLCGSGLWLVSFSAPAFVGGS